MAMEQAEEKAFVYMVRCAGGQLYTGWTNAPISIGLLFESRCESLLSLF